MRIGRQRLLAAAFLAFGLAVSIPASFAAGANQADGVTETGLDARGHLRAVATGRGESFAYMRLEQGVQVRIGQIAKNVIFYGPQTVRVNANLGENYWTAPSLAVTGKSQRIAFTTSETADTLTLQSARLRVEISKKTGALRFLDAAGKLYTEENRDAPQILKKVVVSGAPTFEAANRFTLRPDEAIYGLGFLGEESSNRRGKELLLVQASSSPC
ncbi:alpha-glucosidase domain-containing protein [Xanthomonas translucens]|uniref:alpha-glucosidase domain-containing protein n=1 Tax=Xanthomonas campestris pv. translucens TaxID=343 RepID=UPI001F601685|nr:alpha-glucosidase domain-containing protein [Xanthomonas translucens]